MPVTDFALSASEKANPLWLALRAHLGERLADARARNDFPLADTETAVLRGKIACLKQLIALGDDPLPIPD